MDREQITNSNNKLSSVYSYIELREYLKRINAAANYKGNGDHEDVPIILREFMKGYEQRIKELTVEKEAQAETISGLIEALSGLPVKTVDAKTVVVPRFECKTERIDPYTVREMQERLHEKAEIVSTYGNPTMVDLDDIDQIAEKLLEETNGT